MGDENRRLSFAQRQELVFDKGQGSYEFRPSGVPVAEVNEDVLRQYAAAVGASDPVGLLHARGLADNGMLTIAGCLLFAEEPQRRLPEAYVRVLRYRGRERGTGSRQQLLEDIKVEGPLPYQILEAKDHVSRLQPKRRALNADGLFADLALVPPVRGPRSD